LREVAQSQTSACLRCLCAFKNKKCYRSIDEQQQELYPDEWDYVEKEPEDENDKNLNTYGVDQTRDEANISNGNPEGSPRPANADNQNIVIDPPVFNVVNSDIDNFENRRSPAAAFDPAPASGNISIIPGIEEAKQDNEIELQNVISRDVPDYEE